MRGIVAGHCCWAFPVVVRHCGHVHMNSQVRMAPKHSALTSSPSSAHCTKTSACRYRLLCIILSLSKSATDTPATSSQCHPHHHESSNSFTTAPKSGGERSTESQVVSSTASESCLSGPTFWAQSLQSSRKEAGFLAAAFRLHESTKDNVCSESRRSVKPHNWPPHAAPACHRLPETRHLRLSDALRWNERSAVKHSRQQRYSQQLPHFATNDQQLSSLDTWSMCSHTPTSNQTARSMGTVAQYFYLHVRCLLQYAAARSDVERRLT